MRGQFTKGICTSITGPLLEEASLLHLKLTSREDLKGMQICFVDLGRCSWLTVVFVPLSNNGSLGSIIQ